MSTFVSILLSLVVGFVGGFYVARNPDQVAAAWSRLTRKKPPTEPPKP